MQDRLAFYKIKLLTPSLDEITSIHIAVMGMMAQMTLKHLREKTKRGQTHLNFGNARKLPISGLSMTPTGGAKTFGKEQFARHRHNPWN